MQFLGEAQWLIRRWVGRGAGTRRWMTCRTKHKRRQEIEHPRISFADDVPVVSTPLSTKQMRISTSHPTTRAARVRRRCASVRTFAAQRAWTCQLEWIKAMEKKPTRLAAFNDSSPRRGHIQKDPTLEKYARYRGSVLQMRCGQASPKENVTSARHGSVGASSSVARNGMKNR